MSTLRIMYSIKSTRNDIMSNLLDTAFSPLMSYIYSEIVDSISVMSMSRSPKSLTISARVIMPVFGINPEVMMLLAIATNKAPAPSPNLGSALVGLIKSATSAAATATNNPMNILK